MGARATSRIRVLSAAIGILGGMAAPWAATASATSPVPPGQSVAEARGQVAQRAAAAGRAADRVAAAAAKLNRIEAVAETATERYDGAVVELHKDAVAYRLAQGRSAAAAAIEAARRGAVGALASEAYRTDGGFGSMAAMIGGPGGPQAFFDRAGILRLLAAHDTDVLASATAAGIVAQVFRGQAQQALLASQAAARQAAALKRAAMAAVARQRSALASTRATHDLLLRRLAAARARAGALELAAAAAAAAASATAAAPGTAVPAWAQAPTAAGAPAVAGDTAANWALQQLGKPYVWAAAGPTSYDCSGLTMRAWEQVGVQLDHWTGTQWTSGPHIPIDQMRRGDLVFFANNTADPNTIHHVGIYIGRDMMVDAPYTGVNVRIDSIFEPGLIGATRPAVAPPDLQGLV